ncbi:ChaN family lipoprotein [Hydrogenophaga sp.]|uniref:ChaN family lipoprotein n=1 Tax=Hydrogenophaga sp. TaxID=1904254 RepID=UPI0027251DD6|nr:ChaN family lipoprotein [Hydrogenophaga sp.]MDO8905715.1 ChaN family lipoprotein [Hydrogenophaga sp.]
MNCRSAVTHGLFGACMAVGALPLGGCTLAEPLQTPAAPNPARTASDMLERTMPTPLLLLGEQHDAPDHQRLQRELVRQLASRGELGAVVLEMAPRGRSTSGLAPDATEDQAKEALDWNQANGGWPWPVYGPVVMTAVRAGVPVFGGNLPRAEMAAAMNHTALDQLLDRDALLEQQANIRKGHCDLLPEAQIAPMTRIQIARDQSMALTATSALKRGQTVLLVAGNEHVRRDLGVPRFLPARQAFRVVQSRAQPNTLEDPVATTSQADLLWTSPPQPPRDHCAEMKRQMAR